MPNRERGQEMVPKTSPPDGDTGSIIARGNVEVIEAASPIPSPSVAAP